MTHLRHMASVAWTAALLLVATLAGCGDDEPTGDTGTAPRADGVQLTISVRADADAEPRIVTIDCAPGDDAPPCPAALALDAADFAPTPDDVMCTQQFGGPDEATVTGTINGEAVRADFTRVNGCEIARWDKVVAPLIGG